MKSIKQQYIDLKEGKMSQHNFMRNVRMTLPQWISNITPFEQTLTILKNKGILSESDINVKEIEKNISKQSLNEILIPIKGKQYTWTMGAEYLPIKYIGKRSEYPDIKVGSSIGKGYIFQFQKEKQDYIEVGPQTMRDYIEREEDRDQLQHPDLYPENLNEVKNRISAEQAHPHELAMGRRVEMEHTDNVETAERIALDHLTEDPNYYTKLKFVGLADELEKPKKSNKKRTDVPVEVNKDNLVDKANGMKTPKCVEKHKASSNKAKKETNIPVKGITLMSLIAMKPRGVNKMVATGEKMKVIKLKEDIGDGKMLFKNQPADPKYQVKKNKDTGKIEQATNEEGEVWKLGDKAIAIDNKQEIKINSFIEEQGKVKAVYDSYARPIDIDGLQKPQGVVKPKSGVNLGQSFDKFKDKLKEAIRKELKEMFDGRDNLDATNTEGNEIDPKTKFDIYKSKVIERLIDLDSGQKVIDRINSGRYDKFISSNINKGFTIDKTAMSIRDHWYGVDENQNQELAKVLNIKC